MKIPFDLDSFLARIRQQVGLGGTTATHHPALTKALQSVPRKELVAAAEQHHLHCIPRQSGDQFQFMHLPPK